jgi:hypothetical protein
VNPEGAIVQAPSSTTTTTTFLLVEKKGRKEIYYDRQTGQKVKVEREKD